MQHQCCLNTWRLWNMYFWFKRKLKVKRSTHSTFQSTSNVTDGRQKILSWVLAQCNFGEQILILGGGKKTALLRCIKNIAICSYSAARDVRLRFKAGRLMGTVLERQRCKVQGNSNALHDCAIYLFTEHGITFISLLLVHINVCLCHPCHLLQKAILVSCFQCCWSIVLTQKIVKPEKIPWFLYILSVTSGQHYRDAIKNYTCKSFTWTMKH